MKRYAARRKRLMDELPTGLILVRGRGRSGPNPNFVYLTGLAEERGTLLLAPHGVRIGSGRSNPGRDYMRGKPANQILFLPRRDPLAARWGEDSVATVEETAPSVAAVDAVLPVAELDDLLAQALTRVDTLHYVRAEPQRLGGEDGPDTRYVSHIARRFFHLRLSDATPAVHEMRRIKDEQEVAAIERSIAVTAQALERAVAVARPGAREADVEAEIARVYRAAGGTNAFEPIVGCGANAVLLHYRDNSGPLDRGRLLLIDTGVSIDGYKSDITRTYPLGGTFDPRQREVYETVLAAQREAIAACKPGALVADLHARAYDVIARAGFGDYFVHGIGHHLGLETHDVGDNERPLEPGAVVTIEPGIYIAEESLGVRIEDDVLVTDDGQRVLSRAIPKSIDDAERLAREADG